MVGRESIPITRRSAHCSIHRWSSVHGTVWKSQLLVSAALFTV